MSRPAQCVDDVVKSVDYLFIDIPDLIDVDSDDPTPEPEVIEDRPVYAFNTTAGLQAHHVQQQRPTQTSTYWQQLQQGSSAQPSSALAGLTPPLGSLGASLLDAVSASRLSQQHHQQGTSLHEGLPQQTQDTRQPVHPAQQQHQRRLWQQQATSDPFTSTQSRTTTPVCPTPINDQDMDES